MIKIPLSIHLVHEWHPAKNENLTPMDVTSGSKKEAWWKCYKDSNHEWQALILTRSHGHGCSERANKIKSETT